MGRVEEEIRESDSTEGIIIIEGFVAACILNYRKGPGRLGWIRKGQS